MCKTLVTSTLILLLLFYSTVLQRQLNEQAEQIKSNNQVMLALARVMEDAGLIKIKETSSGKK